MPPQCQTTRRDRRRPDPARRAFPRAAALAFALFFALSASARAEDAASPPSAAESAAALEAEAVRHWDDKEYDKAVAKYREAIRLDPRGETYRSLGWLYAERDRHEEAIAAFRAAIAADPALEPELRLSLGEELLWADRAREAVPLLESVVAARPSDPEARRLLALAYRWSDRPGKAECLYRELLADNPTDAEARSGLGESLLWQGRFRESRDAFAGAVAARPSDAEALTGLSRALLFLDLPEDAEPYAARAVAAAPGDKEASDQAGRVRERLRRRAEAEFRLSRDSDELTIALFDLSVHGRPARGLDMHGNARQTFFRQGSPGKEANIGSEDSVDGTGGSVSAAYRAGPGAAFRAGLGLARYDTAGFHPWSANAGATLDPADGVALSLDWERSHFDTILSFQDRVTADTLTLSASWQRRFRTEFKGSFALIFHHNENATGQPRENRGSEATAEVTHPLYVKGDDVHIAGIARARWLSFEHDLDVGVFDPRRYTSEEAGVDWRWRFRPAWEFFGTVLGGAQQEKGNRGGPMYDAETGVDRRFGRGVATVAAFATDSNAGGRGGGYRRYGGWLRISAWF